MTNSHRTAEGTTAMSERHVCIETPCSVCGYSEDFTYTAVASDINNIDAPYIRINFVHRPALGEVVKYEGRDYRLVSYGPYSADRPAVPGAETMNASIVRDLKTLQAMRKSVWDLFTDGYISQSAHHKAIKAINADIDKLI